MFAMSEPAATLQGSAARASIDEWEKGSSAADSGLAGTRASANTSGPNLDLAVAGEIADD
jgi:hypothetical protein